MLILFSTKSSAMCRNLRPGNGREDILRAKARVLSRFGGACRSGPLPKRSIRGSSHALRNPISPQAKTIFFALTQIPRDVRLNSFHSPHYSGLYQQQWMTRFDN
jgi:hypothetical protein